MDFVQYNQGEPVPEETFTHSHLSWPAEQKLSNTVLHVPLLLCLSMLCVIDEVGPKLSEVNKLVAQPEPLVRDESLRRTDIVREWDKAKKPFHGNCLMLQLFLFITAACL